METENKKEKLPKGFVRRKDGRLVARYYDRGGNRHEVIQRKGETKKELERRRDKLNYEAQYGNKVKMSKLTVKELGEEWLKSLRVKKTTSKGYHTNMNHINDFMGDKRIDAVTEYVINDMYDYLIDETPYTYGTVLNIRQTLYSLFEYARNQRFMIDNPVERSKKIDESKFEYKSKDKALTERQQEIFLKHIEKSHYYEMFNIMLLTGMRIGEVLGLRWEDVFLEDKFIRVERNLVCTTEDGKATGAYLYEITSPKTQQGFREIPLCDEAVVFFKSQLEKRKEDRIIDKAFGDLVFTGRNGNRVSDSNIRRILRSASKAIQKKECPDMPTIYPHMLRHTFATRAVESGMNFKALSTILGHSKYQFTLNQYVHEQTKHLQEEMSKFKVVGLSKVL
jgi:integrase